MSDKTELKPCPICNESKARLSLPTCEERTPYDPSHRAYPIVRCGGCGTEVPGDNWDHTGKSAVTKWNRRTVSEDTPPSSPAPADLTPEQRADMLHDRLCKAIAEDGIGRPWPDDFDEVSIDEIDRGDVRVYAKACRPIIAAAIREAIVAARAVAPAGVPEPMTVAARLHPIIREMVDVAAADPDGEWMSSQRAQVDLWQSAIRDACAPHDPYAPPAGAPEGFVLAPKVATDEMCEAAWNSDAVDQIGEHRRFHSAHMVWDAMLSAAPTAQGEGIAWKPIEEAKLGVGGIVLGNANGVYASDAMPEKWAQGFVREDGTAWDSEGYPLNPTHFFEVPDLPSAPSAPSAGEATKP